MGDAIMGAIILAFVVGGAAALILWNVGAWVLRHLTIGWN